MKRVSTPTFINLPFPLCLPPTLKNISQINCQFFRTFAKIHFAYNGLSYLLVLIISSNWWENQSLSKLQNMLLEIRNLRIILLLPWQHTKKTNDATKCFPCLRKVTLIMETRMETKNLILKVLEWIREMTNQVNVGDKRVQTLEK